MVDTKFWSPIRTLTLSFIDNKKEKLMKKVIKSVYFRRYECLRISFEITALGSLEFRYYAKEFLSIMWRVNRELVLYGMTIGKRHFEQIFNNTSHLERLEFYICKIESQDVRFRKDLDYNVKVLSFISSGEVSNSNWLVHPPRFESILKAISQ